MHIRKWLRILIDRSLLLGTIDRPSVHDLVLDWAVAQHSKEELREKHRAIVMAFRATRPLDFYGRGKYDKSLVGSPLNSYVCNEVEHHVVKGWDVAFEKEDLENMLDVGEGMEERDAGDGHVTEDSSEAPAASDTD